MFKLYKIDCKKSKRSYIGLTKQKVEVRIRQHFNDAKRFRGNTAIGHAIRKHGSDSFTYSVIASALSLEDAMATEICLIDQHSTLRPNGYNVTVGGEAGFNWMSDEQRKLTRARVGIKLKGKKHSPSFGENISKKKKGVPLTEQNLESIRQSKGRLIRCIDNNEVFFGVQGYRLFADRLGINSKLFSSVVSCCKGRAVKAMGLRFEYEDGTTVQKIRERDAKTQPLVSSCVPNFVFISVTQAANWVADNGNKKAATSSISKCCKGTLKTAYGSQWSYYVNSKD